MKRRKISYYHTPQRWNEYHILCLRGDIFILFFAAADWLFHFCLSVQKNYTSSGVGPVLFFVFHLGMNSISPGARFTEPTRENKDALIRNIRGEKNHCCCECPEWMPVGGVHVFIKPQWWKKRFVPHSSEKDCVHNLANYTRA